MNVDWSEFGVDWALLALRIAFVAVLYLFLMQVTKVMLREIRIVAAAKAPTSLLPKNLSSPTPAA